MLDRLEEHCQADLPYREALRALAAAPAPTDWERLAAAATSADEPPYAALEAAATRLEEIDGVSASPVTLAELVRMATWAGRVQNEMAERHLRAAREAWRLAVELADHLNSIRLTHMEPASPDWVLDNLDAIQVAATLRLAELGAA